MIYLPLMVYNKIIEGSGKESQSTSIFIYPFTIDNFKQLYPEVEIPEFYNFDFFAGYGAEMVWPTDKPDYDPSTQKVIELRPQFIGGTWNQRWSVVNLNEEELFQLELDAIDKTNREAELLLLSIKDLMHLALINGQKFSTEFQAYIDALKNPSTLAGYPFATEFPSQPENIFDGDGLPINAYSKQESDSRYVIA